MITTEHERKLFRIISRQKLSEGDAEWLKLNIPDDDNWPSLALTAFNEGIISFFYCHYRDLNILQTLPEDISGFFRRIYTETLLINQHNKRIMEELENHLAGIKLPVIALKGAALLNDVYRDIALRPMEDIDLMVREEDIGELKKVLIAMGFIQNNIYPNTLSKGILSIDLHSDYTSSHRIRSRRHILNVQSGDVWTRAVPLNGGVSLHRLSLCDNLIALSYHLLKHRYDRLIWFIDLAETINKYGSASMWKEVVEYSCKVNASSILLYAALLAKHLIEAEVPDDVFFALGKEKLSSIEKYLLRLRLIYARPGTAMDFLWLYQIRGAVRKIGFIFENAFPRLEIMEQIYPYAPRRVGNILRRSLKIPRQVLSDHLSSIRYVWKSGLPRL